MAAAAAACHSCQAECVKASAPGLIEGLVGCLQSLHVCHRGVLHHDSFHSSAQRLHRLHVAFQLRSELLQAPVHELLQCAAAIYLLLPGIWSTVTEEGNSSQPLLCPVLQQVCNLCIALLPYALSTVATIHWSSAATRQQPGSGQKCTCQLACSANCCENPHAISAASLIAAALGPCAYKSI